MTSTSTSMDPRTPVLVGVGQLNVRPEDSDPSVEPVELIAEAVRRAVQDSGAPGLVAAIESIRVVSLISWRYRNPAARVADLIGAQPRETAVSPMGGDSPQSLVNLTARDIAAGKLSAAIICGGEAWRTRHALRRSGATPTWPTDDPNLSEATQLGTELEMSHPVEAAHGVTMPIQVYPLFETALRSAAGLAPAEHLRRISELWARFAAVAAANPYADVTNAPSAEEIRTPSPANRWVGYPYTKLLVSNDRVNQAAALVICSAEVASSLGVPRDRWVFPQAGSSAAEPFVSLRQDLHRSPAMRAAGLRTFELAAVDPAEIAHVDLYSCFPSAVQIAVAELGIDPDRQLTVTGGLTFAGGPWNNYVTHAIATMAGVLREDAGSLGLCTANGGMISKHAHGLYSTEPPAGGFRYESAQDEADRAPRREVLESYDGPATVEAYTVMHGGDGAPQQAIATCTVADGQRAWATSTDPAVMAELEASEGCGRSARISAGELSLLG